MTSDLAMLVRAYERGSELAAAEGDEGREALYLEIATDHFEELRRSFIDQGMTAAQAVVWSNCAVLRIDPHEALRAAS